MLAALCRDCMDLTMSGSRDELDKELVIRVHFVPFLTRARMLSAMRLRISHGMWVTWPCELLNDISKLLCYLQPFVDLYKL